MNPKKTSKEKILAAALQEFAARGFSGARMENIAKKARINKAMLFYYFASKKRLYQTILQMTLTTLFSEISPLVTPDLSAEQFLEIFPEIYIRFFARNREHLKIIGFDLIQNPENITAAIAEIIPRTPLIQIRSQLTKSFQQWHRQGAISEDDPVQVMLSIVSLSVFSFLARPMVETLSGTRILDNQAFYSKRTRSVVNLLKQGLLK